MGRGRVALGGIVRIAVVFPGQGSQSVGMGCEVAACSSAAAAVFDRASAVLGYDLLELQRRGPEEQLRETEFSQPAIFTTNLALYAAVGDALKPVVTAGHSFARTLQLGDCRIAFVRRCLADRQRTREGDAIGRTANARRNVGDFGARRGARSRGARTGAGSRPRSARKLQLPDADRDQRPVRCGSNGRPRDACSRGQACRTAERLGCLA